MDPFHDWLHLLIRWFHVVVAVAWLGQTWLFSWMDRTLEPVAVGEGGADGGAGAQGGVEGRLWMVHSGGFYRVDKQRVVPARMPATLHWFKWEAALTWLSGLALLGIVYYAGGAIVAFDSPVTTGQGIAIGLGALVLGWVVYDLLWRSPLGRRERLGATLSFALIVGAGWGLLQLLSARAAYLHLGAVFGTIMTANVWLRILPAQRQLVAATRAGTAADPALAARAKQRSKHNTYLSVPVIFLMISSHFPVTTYGHRLNWLVLGVLVLLGWAGRKLMTLAK
jgi:uncharacterized membrane protein